jgi:phosphoribosyl 1,2-cyclic phosphate phosphodiesterase
MDDGRHEGEPMKVTILGCGGSGGVPLAAREPGGYWGACDPANPKNRRRRVSIHVEEEGASILIDTSPDLRLQLLDNGITRLDALLYTHAHGDHCHGIDDLRALAFSQGGPIDAYMDAKTRERLTRRFDYVFASSRKPNSLYPPMLSDRLVDGPFQVGEVGVVPFQQTHGDRKSVV